MDTMFVRYVLVDVKNPDFGFNQGLFKVAYDLARNAAISAERRDELSRLLGWFDDHLAVPSRFNRSSSKGFYRRKSQGIAWFKSSATEHLAHMQKLAVILESCGWKVARIEEDRIGYRVFEDEYQVIAEPFRDTRRR
jgi:hypothetical protein